MRRGAAAVAVAVLIGGCGSGEKKPATTATATQPAQRAPHPRRPPGSVYANEVGENIVTVPRARIVNRFGRPASTRGNCIRYRIVRQPKQEWEFCFKGQKMTSAAAVPAR